MNRAVLLAMLAVGCLAGAGHAHTAPAGYPTETLADYVFGCMATNGQTEDAMRRCSCSIDYIAAQLNYDEYVQAETVLRMQQIPGGDGRAVMFRNSAWAQQVEAEVRCF